MFVVTLYTHNASEALASGWPVDKVTCMTYAHFPSSPCRTVGMELVQQAKYNTQDSPRISRWPKFNFHSLIQLFIGSTFPETQGCSKTFCCLRWRKRWHPLIPCSEAKLTSSWTILQYWEWDSGQYAVNASRQYKDFHLCNKTFSTSLHPAHSPNLL